MLFQYSMMVIALCFSGDLLSGQTVVENRAQLDLTPRAIRHIQERHWPDSPAPGAGKYATGITVDALREMIQQAVTHGRARQNTNGRPGQIYEYDFERPIGTRIDGGPATRIRVVVSPRNKVVTAFPF